MKLTIFTFEQFVQEVENRGLKIVRSSINIVDKTYSIPESENPETKEKVPARTETYRQAEIVLGANHNGQYIMEYKDQIESVKVESPESEKFGATLEARVKAIREEFEKKGITVSDGLWTD